MRRKKYEADEKSTVFSVDARSPAYIRYIFDAGKGSRKKRKQ